MRKGVPRKTSMKALSAQRSGGKPQPAEKRDRESERHAERAARAPAEDRHAEAEGERGQVAPEDVEVHRASPAASRRSASAPNPASVRLIAR